MDLEKAYDRVDREALWQLTYIIHNYFNKLLSLKNSQLLAHFAIYYRRSCKSRKCEKMKEITTNIVNQISVTASEQHIFLKCMKI